MRLVHLFAILALLAGIGTGSAFGQTAVERFENKAKAPLSAVPKAESSSEADPAAKPYMGVQADDEKDAANRGAVILGVTKGGPADTGGLKAGDTMIAIDGKPIRNWNDVDTAMVTAKVGTKLIITVRRGLLQETKTIALGRKPADPAPTVAEPADAPLSTAPSATPPATEPPSATPPESDTLPPIVSPMRNPAAPSLTPRPSTALRDPPAAPLLGPAADPATPPATIPPTPPAADPDLSLSPAPGPAADPPAGFDSLAPPATTESPAGDPGAAVPLGTGRATLGVSVVPLTAETRAQYEIRSSARQGAIIHSVRPGSPADLAGFPIGGVIVSIDGQLVKSSDDLAAAVAAARPGQEVELRYFGSDGELATKSVRLAPAAATAIVPATPRTTPRESSNLRRFEEMTEPGATDVPLGSTIADPSRVAKLYEEVMAMREKITTLEERVKLLEAKLGGEAPAVNP